jgi:predicted nucleotidyltransferase
MRLSSFEIKAIKESAKEIFGECKVYLFGSRVDDNLKGGDIDLYIQIPQKPEFLSKEKYLALLKRKIGEQKIDVIISYPEKEKTLIDEEALKKGILL